MSGVTNRARLARLLVVLGLVAGTVAVANGESVAAVPPRAVRATLAGGFQHSMVLKEDGTLWTFGRNLYGQLGHATNSGSNVANSTPTQVLTDVVAIAAGDSHSLALKADGSLYAFGQNSSGQLGVGDVDSSPNPTPEQVMTDVAAIAAGELFSLVLKTDGSLWSFGSNSYGQLGHDEGSGTDTEQPPTEVMTDVAAIAAGASHGLAVMTDGTVWTFGRNNAGQLGRTENSVANPTPTQVGGIADVVAVAGGQEHSLALAADGAVFAFGGDAYGELGDGTSGSASSTPTEVNSGVAAVAARGNQSFVLKLDGTLWSFGYNFYGQLGHETGNLLVSANATPVEVLSNVTEVASGNFHTLALKTDGTLVSFGSDSYGQLGDGTAADGGAHETPTQILTEVLQPESYVSLVPGRLLDTRPSPYVTVDGVEDDGLRAAASTTELTVAGRGGVPLDAESAVLNVTVNAAQAYGFLTVYPCGTKRPTASNLNFYAGDTIPNLVVSKIGDDGKVCLYSSQGSHLIVDVNGFYPATSTFESLVPGRLLDTRPAPYVTVDAIEDDGVRAAASTTELQVAGRGGVPIGAVAAVLNVTVTGALDNGFVTVWPCGVTKPTASNLNFTTGKTIPNLVFAEIGVDNEVCLYTSKPTNLIVDVAGYFPVSSTFIPLTPGRLLDTRPPPYVTVDAIEDDGERTAASTTELQVTGRAGVLDDMTTVVLNVTVTGAQAYGFVTVYPCGTTRPTASNLNYQAGATIPNLVVTKLGTDGTVCIYTSQAINLIVDVSGYFGIEDVAP